MLALPELADWLRWWRDLRLEEDAASVKEEEENHTDMMLQPR